VTHPTVPGRPQDTTDSTADSTAAGARQPCTCQEDPDNPPCAHAVPVTREQIGRLRAYAAQHPGRAIIMSELTGEWMSALADFLPDGADGEERVLTWMRDPYALPPAAELRSSDDLGELLDTLGAPPAAAKPSPSVPDRATA
jgi:hypothetical protein